MKRMQESRTAKQEKRAGGVPDEDEAPGSNDHIFGVVAKFLVESWIAIEGAATAGPDAKEHRMPKDSSHDFPKGVAAPARRALDAIGITKLSEVM